MHKTKFKKNGYIIFKNFLNLKKINTLKYLIKNIQKKNNQNKTREPGNKLTTIGGLLNYKQIDNLILKNKKFINICETLIGKNYKVWNCKANLKPKWYGMAEYYHQDYVYWKKYGLRSNRSFSCMIFLDQHNPLNGGINIFPSSHNKVYEHSNFLNINSQNKKLIPKKILDKIFLKKKYIFLDEPAGSCIFFHSKLVHGSGQNISNKNRAIILLQISTKLDVSNYKRLNKSKIFEKTRLYEIKELKKRLKIANKL